MAERRIAARSELEISDQRQLGVEPLDHVGERPAGEGVSDFERYRIDPSEPLAVDFFVPDESKPPPGVSLGARM